MANFVTVKEAQTLTGKSLSTILRFIRKHKDDQSAVRRSLVDGHWQFEVEKGVLQSKYGHNDRSNVTGDQSAVEAETQHNATPKSKPTADSEIVNKLIDTLQKQLEEKDKTIQALINHNHQLSGALAQLNLPAPKNEERPENGEILSEKEEPEEKQSPTMTNEAGPEEKTTSPSPKKGNIIGRILRAKLF